jgi:hypothetical protein
MNAVRARDGVPYGHVGGYIGKTDVSYEYWSNIVDRLGQMLGLECQPWPSERMKPFVPSWSEYEREGVINPLPSPPLNPHNLTKGGTT